jgi:chemotaxis protein MotB
MKSKLVWSVVALLAALPLASCTAKYEDAIRDRDAQIREMKKREADLRTENADLLRREQQAREALDGLQRDFDARLAEATAKKPAAKQEGSLDDLRSQLGSDLDVRYSRGRISIGVPSTVSFDSGSAVLTAKGKETLSRVARVLKERFSGKRIYVEGHTDTDPIKETKDKFRSNRHLSAERADAVATWLTTRGALPEPSVVIVGFGEYDPLPGAKSDKSRNRRVEIVIGD